MSRILLVTRNLPPLVGGMERLNWHMAEELAKVADVRVVGPVGSAALAPAGVRVCEVPLKPLWKFLLCARSAARREARDWKPDVVLGGSGLAAPLVQAAARICGARTAVYVHGLDVATRHPVYRAVWIPALRRIDRVIANSHATATLCRSVGIDAARIGIVHPGVDVPADASLNARSVRVDGLASPAASASAESAPPSPVGRGGGGEGTGLSGSQSLRVDPTGADRHSGAGSTALPATSAPVAMAPPLPLGRGVGGEGTGLSGSQSLRVAPTGADRHSGAGPAGRNPESVSTAFRQRHGLGDGPLLLSVGRLSARKGLREFVTNALPRIVAAHPGTILIAVGEAPKDALHATAQTPDSIRAAAAAAGVADDLRFLGKIADDELDAAYRTADVHVFPVRELPGNPEGFGMVAVEAAAHGLPTVAFANGGVVDAVVEGVSGHLVQPGDYTAFADAVLSVLDQPYAALGASCIAYARAFAWPEFGRQLIACLPRKGAH